MGKKTVEIKNINLNYDDTLLLLFSKFDSSQFEFLEGLFKRFNINLICYGDFNDEKYLTLKEIIVINKNRGNKNNGGN